MSGDTRLPVNRVSPFDEYGVHSRSTGLAGQASRTEQGAEVRMEQNGCLGKDNEGGLGFTTLIRNLPRHGVRLQRHICALHIIVDGEQL